MAFFDISWLGPTVVAKDVVYNGQTRTLHFRKLTGAEADEVSIALMGEDNKFDPGKLRGNIARQLAMSLCDDNGKPVTTASEIDQLPVAFRKVLQDAYDEVNGGADAKND